MLFVNVKMVIMKMAMMYVKDVFYPVLNVLVLIITNVKLCRLVCLENIGEVKINAPLVCIPV